MNEDLKVEPEAHGAQAGATSVDEHVYVFPLSSAQQRLLFLSQMDPQNASYNIAWSIRITGEPNVEALERSLNEIVRRHEILRTTFDVIEGHASQIVSPTRHIPLVQEDLRNTPDPEAAARAVANQEAGTPLNLKTGPLIRTRLLRLGEKLYVLLITTHHISFDGWSRRILVGELDALYSAYCNGRPSPLAELPLQYADYAVWQQSYLEGERLANLLSYWKQQLTDAPTTVDLPTDHPRPAVQSYRGASQSMLFPKALADEVVRASQQHGVTTFMTLLAAFNLLLARYSGRDDILVGTVIANRNRAELEGLIGLFANTLPLRTRLDGDPTFLELLGRVKETALGAYAHQEMPFERLVEELRPERSASYNPLFQVVFSLQSAARRTFELSGLQLEPFGGAIAGTSKFDLSFFALEGADGLSGRVEYNTDLFEADTIRRMLRHYMRLLELALAEPDTPVSRLQLLDEAERHRILVEFNDTAADFACDIRLHDFVARQAELSPDATALVCPGEQVSYRELNERANQLAHYLIKHGAGPESLIGIHSERTASMVFGILGILKSGSAYVPLDPFYPRERIHNILEDSGARLVLTHKSIADALPKFEGELILLDDDSRAISQEPTSEPRTEVTPDNLAYVLFTSGSTGRPKGVAIEHRNAVTFVQWAQQVFTPKELAGVLFSTSICFDLSVFEMFVPLSVGGKVVAVENALQLPSFAFRDEVTLVNTVPSAMTELLRLGGVPKSVITVNLAGEALSDALVENIYASTLVRQVYNLYGPTEDTTYSTYTPVQRGTSVTIGKPIANSQSYVLDAKRQLVPIGVPGELYLAGSGLARGYFGRPDLTNERFVPNPFAEEGARMYRTGDLARWLPDGNLDYLGRIDHQVKLRGFRIELGEIESVLLAHPAVQQAVVVVREDRPGDQRLVAYFVAKTGQETDSGALSDHLEQSVPGYMVPSAFIRLKALPVNANGKVDRNALPIPQWSHLSAGTKTAPGDPLEAILVRTWERVLGVSNIGVYDDFFDLGGHSLLAMRLLAEVEKVVGRTVPLASLFRGATVAAQAKLLRHGAESAPEPLVMEFQRGSTGTPPLFVIAAPGVQSLGYVLLARTLGNDQPFYKLQARAPIVQDRPLSATEIRTIASQCVAGMRAVQPDGPYYLAAMCVGCHIAEQMILKLESQGQTVALFAIFDTWVLENTRRPWASLLYSNHQRLRWLRQVSFREKVDWVRRALSLRARIWLGKAKPSRFWAEVYWPQDFKPPRFKAPIILFRRREQPYCYIDDPLLGWGPRSDGGVKAYEVKSQHHEVLREPEVHYVTQVLVEHMTAATTSPSAPNADACVLSANAAVTSGR
jgi:amino acid adenylation domain-containing protein